MIANVRAWAERKEISPSFGIIVTVTFVLALLNLDGLPCWRDEGWTLTVARNWVERGYYGMLLSGEPAPPGLAAAFPSVTFTALSFRLLGVGIWQGRLVQLLFMTGALGFLYVLASRLYNRRVARATVLCALFLASHLEMNPFYMGRQVLAEPLMLFFLLAGYWFFWLAFDRIAWMLPAWLMWGIALVAKTQTLPFWVVSLIAPLLIALIGRQRQAGLRLIVGFVGALVVAQLIPLAQQGILQTRILPSPILSDLVTITAVAPNSEVRLFALSVVLLIGLPTTLGLIYAMRDGLGNWRTFDLDVRLETVRWMLATLVSSWYAWYLTLSVGWIRYFFPVAFLGSLFVAKFLHDATAGFSVKSMLDRVGDLVLRRRVNRASVSALLAMLLLMIFVPLTLQQLGRLTYRDPWLAQMAQMLNTRTAADALVESYDNEIFFLLNRHYHYPPDSVSVDLIRRTELGQVVAILYDPLAADPDYLVVGNYGRESQLYNPVLASGAVRLLERFGPYDVYQRIR